MRTHAIIVRYPNSAVARMRVCEELGVSPRQARRYIRGVRLLWKLQGTSNMEAYRLEAEQVLLGLFEKAEAKGDIKAATAAYWRLIQLRGLDPAIKVEHKHHVSGEKEPEWLKGKSNDELTEMLTETRH